ncbi:MAG: hypothetical protein HQM02_00830 [Magnetococcales bacterium]|nr:hypothetical protein [Magnetococcales bacterium]
MTSSDPLRPLLLLLALLYYSSYAWLKAFNWGDEGYLHYVAFALQSGQKLYDDIQVYSYLPGLFLLFQSIFELFGAGVFQGRILMMAGLVLVPMVFYATASRFVPTRLAFLMALILLLVPGPWDRSYIALLNLGLLAGACSILGDSPGRGGTHFGLMLGLALTLRIDAAYGGLILLLTCGALRWWQRDGSLEERPFAWLWPTLGTTLLAGSPVWLVLASQGILDDYGQQWFGFGGAMAHRIGVERLPPPPLTALGAWSWTGLNAWIFYGSFVPFLLLLQETLRRFWESRPGVLRQEAALRILLCVWCLLQIPQYALERPDTPHLSQRAFAILLALAVALHAAWGRSGLFPRIVAALMMAYGVFYPLKMIAANEADTGFITLLGLGRNVSWHPLPNGVSCPFSLPATPGTEDDYQRIITYIINNTTPNDRVATLPWQPGINFCAQRLMPGRHLFLFPEFMRPGIEEVVIADLSKASTRFIVLFPDLQLHQTPASLPAVFMPQVMAHLAHHETVLEGPGVRLLRRPDPP